LCVNEFSNYTVIGTTYYKYRLNAVPDPGIKLPTMKPNIKLNYEKKKNKTTFLTEKSKYVA
jgi:hypothetical protein